MKNQSQQEKKTNKKRGTGPTSIMRQGSKYYGRGSEIGSGRGRGRGGRSGANQRQVRTNAKPAEHKINTTGPKRQPGAAKQEEVHLFTLKASPAVMEAKETVFNRSSK